MSTNVNDFVGRLQKLKGFMDPNIVQAMGVAQNLVVQDAKANHERAPEGGEHPSSRYYDRTGNLTGSIRPGNVRVYLDAIEGEVHAGGAAAGGSVAYAAAIEHGTKTGHKAYPYIGPALESQKEKVLAVFEDAVKKALR